MIGRKLGLIVAAISVLGMTVAGPATAAGAPASDHRRPMALPSIEDLTLGSDFTVFMAPGVPTETQRLALWKLWRLMGWQSDGLGTYIADYTVIEPLRRVAGPADTIPAALAAR